MGTNWVQIARKEEARFAVVPTACGNVSTTCQCELKKKCLMKTTSPQAFSVGMTGFEPAAPWPPARCATKLRHIPLLNYWTVSTILLLVTPRRPNDSTLTENRVIPRLRSCRTRREMHGLHDSGPLLVPSSGSRNSPQNISGGTHMSMAILDLPPGHG